MRSRFLASVFGAIFGLTLSVAHSTPPNDPVLGTWKLNVDKSTFTPGPAWQNQIRVYQTTEGTNRKGQAFSQLLVFDRQ